MHYYCVTRKQHKIYALSKYLTIQHDAVNDGLYATVPSRVYLSRVTGTLYPMTNTFLVLILLSPDNHCSTSMNLTIANFTKGGAKLHLSFCDWLISFNITSSRFFCVVANGRLSFCFKAE